MPRRVEQVHTLQSAQVAARRLLLHHSGTAPRAHRRHRQGGLRERHRGDNHLHRTGRRLHHRHRQRHTPPLHRLATHPRRCLRPGAGGAHHHGHHAPLPLVGHTVGQPRHTLDGGCGGQRCLHLQRDKALPALCQPHHAGGGLRHQPRAAGHLCHGDLRRRPLHGVQTQTLGRVVGERRKDAATHGTDAQGHRHHTVQAREPALRTPSLVEHAEAQPLQAHRLREGNHRPRRQDLQAHIVFLPHHRPQNAQLAHQGGDDAHAQAPPLVHGERKIGQAHTHTAATRLHVHHHQQQPALPRLVPALRRRHAEGGGNLSRTALQRTGPDAQHGHDDTHGLPVGLRHGRAAICHRLLPLPLVRHRLTAV